MIDEIGFKDCPIFFLEIKKEAARFGKLKYYINPLAPDTSFLHPLKTSENCKVFWCFQGVEKWCIGNEWVKKDSIILPPSKSS